MDQILPIVGVANGWTTFPGVLGFADYAKDEQIYTYASGGVMDGLMGKRNYLIDGVSGAGKTAVCTELQRCGYQAIHGDR